MNTKKYRLLHNSFVSQTRNSHSRAVKLSTDTTDKLRTQTMPELLAIYNAYLPFHEAYINLNVAVEIATGTYKGKTAGFETVMDALPTKLRQWEPPVYLLFPEDSPVALEIFPRKRVPFYDSNYEQRLIALQALRDKLATLTAANPTLVPVQADVAAYYTLAKTSREAQQGLEGNLSELRNQREAQRISTMDAFWGLVYGGLLSICYNAPQQITGYIDLDELYENNQDDVVTVGGNLTIGQVVNINALLPDLNAEPDTVLRLRNKSASNASLVFYAATTASELPGAGTQFTVNAGNTLEKTIAEMGFSDPYSFFNVLNNGPEPTEWEIEVML